MINITPTAFHRKVKNNFRKKQYLSNGRRFNYQMQLNWFRRAFDKKAVRELGS